MGRILAPVDRVGYEPDRLGFVGIDLDLLSGRGFRAAVCRRGIVADGGGHVHGLGVVQDGREIRGVARAGIHKGYRGGVSREGAVIVALQPGDFYAEGTRLVVSVLIVDKLDGDRKLGHVSVEHKGAGGRDVVRSRLGGPVLGRILHRNGALDAALAADDELYAAVGLVGVDGLNGKADSARIGLVYVVQVVKQGLRPAVDLAAVGIGYHKGRALYALDSVVGIGVDVDLLLPLALGEGEAEDPAGIHIVGINKLKRRKRGLGVELDIRRHLLEHLFGLFLVCLAGKRRGAVSLAVYGVYAAEVVLVEIFPVHRKCRAVVAADVDPSAAVPDLPLIRLGLNGEAEHVALVVSSDDYGGIPRLGSGKLAYRLILGDGERIFHLDRYVIPAERVSVIRGSVLIRHKERRIGDIRRCSAVRAAETVDGNDGVVALACLDSGHVEGKGSERICLVPAFVYFGRVAL